MPVDNLHRAQWMNLMRDLETEGANVKPESIESHEMSRDEMGRIIPRMQREIDYLKNELSIVRYQRDLWRENAEAYARASECWRECYELTRRSRDD